MPAPTQHNDRDDRAYRVGGRVVAGFTLAAMLLVGAGGWAATAQLSGAVIATGTVKVDRNLRAIQHRDGGIVSDIAVSEGDRVEAGQVLIRLEDAQTSAELSIVRAQLLEMTARRARLVAEREADPAFGLPADVDAGDPQVAALVASEMRLLEGNRQNRMSQKQQLELSIDQLGQEIEGLDAQRQAKLRESELVGDEHRKIAGLAARGLIEGSRATAGEREIARLEGETGEIEASIARSRARISEIRLQIIAIDETARTEAQRELSVVEPRIAELSERATAIEDRLARTEIRAPVAGTVNEIAVNTIGGVITPAEKLVTIVPAGAELRIEAQINPADIDQIDVGQPARLRFSAFNQRTTPELDGRIAYVSPATSIDPQTGLAHYVARITASEAELARLGSDVLKPGMPLEVYIETESRTALSYIAKPLTDQFARALREE